MDFIIKIILNSRQRQFVVFILREKNSWKYFQSQKNLFVGVKFNASIFSTPSVMMYWIQMIHVSDECLQDFSFQYFAIFKQNFMKFHILFKFC